jgi:hypothetical protein
MQNSGLKVIAYVVINEEKIEIRYEVVKVLKVGAEGLEPPTSRM